MKFPNGKRFAFSILDDTDDSTLENVKPVYDLLRSIGLRTTKTVWAFECPDGSEDFYAADTLQRQPYLDFVHSLATEGYEVAFHGATMESSLREQTVKAFDFLRGEFGSYPRLFCNHGFNQENLYWGEARFQTKMFRLLSRIWQKRAKDYYLGEVPGASYFWGDVCKRHVRYVRNFTFQTLNMLSVNPEMPYSLLDTPYVNFWFSSADAPDAQAFKLLLSHERLDRLQEEGGVCILSTHLGKGFSKNGMVDPQIEDILRYLASKEGWFVPVSDILDHLLNLKTGSSVLAAHDRIRLETRFLLDRVIGIR